MQQIDGEVAQSDQADNESSPQLNDSSVGDNLWALSEDLAMPLREWLRSNNDWVKRGPKTIPRPLNRP